MTLCNDLKAVKQSALKMMNTFDLRKMEFRDLCLESETKEVCNAAFDEMDAMSDELKIMYNKTKRAYDDACK